MKPIRSLFISFLSLLTLTALAQEKYATKNGKISFTNKGPFENIEARNKGATCVLDSKTGNLQFLVLIKGFEFEKSLMQEHFNENYLESTKFPKCNFTGQITNNSTVNYAADGSYDVTVKGKLTLHGVTNDITAPGKLTVKGGKIQAVSDFSIALPDYKIKTDKIAKTVKIHVDCSLDPLKK
jgi:YceI-like domain